MVATNPKIRVTMKSLRSGSANPSSSVQICTQNGPTRPAKRVIRAFSLLELLVVLAISAMLMALLMPHFTRLRESARQAGCSSNQHQIGLAIALYADEYQDSMPYSRYSYDHDSGALKMMAAYVGSPNSWDSMGLLYGTPSESLRFIRSPKVLYCPSHFGLHPLERYEKMWANPGNTTIETNYHYRQTIDRPSNSYTVPTSKIDFLQRNFAEEPILTDGMQTKQDFNHVVGANMLRLDSSVKWFTDTNGELYSKLPDVSGEPKWGDNPWHDFSNRQ